MMLEKDLLRELDQLRALPNTVEDWRDLHETIEGYQARCLARAIARSPKRDELVASIQTLAGEGTP